MFVCIKFFLFYQQVIGQGTTKANFTSSNVKQNKRKNAFSNRVANYWNCLPTNIKFAPSTNIFKNLLDDTTKFQEYFYSFDS